MSPCLSHEVELPSMVFVSGLECWFLDLAWLEPEASVKRPPGLLNRAFTVDRGELAARYGNNDSCVLF
jgi:hypothetical protein